MPVTSPIFTREILEKLSAKTVELDPDSSFSFSGFLSGRMRPNYCRLEVIAERINRFHFGFWGRRMRRRPAHSRCSDLFVHIDERDIAKSVGSFSKIFDPRIAAS